MDQKYRKIISEIFDEENRVIENLGLFWRIGRTYSILELVVIDSNETDKATLSNLKSIDHRKATIELTEFSFGGLLSQKLGTNILI